MTTVENTPAEADAPPPDPNAVNVTINGRPFVARKGELVIKAAQRAGEYIPHFCYHERMTPVGKCRMCLVEADGGRGPAVTVACMVPVSPDMKIETESPMAKRMQEGMLELLLANHPLDCPVCDKGGECPLQDQAFSHGPGESRYVEEKRHYEKPIPISDLVFLDRERCILCDRCTRFADEVAGDPLIHFTHRGNNTQIQTFPDEPFSSYFSGNTVQICPVGALSAQPYRFKARPWDIEQVESTCTTCAVGCRTVVQSSRDELVRYMGVDSDPVNHGWLCDRGRFNFEAVKSDQRLTHPSVRKLDQVVTTTWAEAMAAATTAITEALAAGGPQSVAVLGGARGTNEDAYALARLAREVIGTPNIYCQLGDGLPLSVLGLPRATIDEAASAATIILLGPDLKEELPVLYLRLRDAATKRRSRVVEFTPKASGLTPYAWKSVSYEPGTQPAVVAATLADAAVAAQLATGNVVIVAGKANLAEGAEPTLAALAMLLDALPGAKVLPAYRRGNVVGAAQLGLAQSPGGMHGKQIMTAASEGRIECLILVGADPLADFPDTAQAERALANAKRVIVIDTHPTGSATWADVVLPAAAYAEKSGTTTNLEGRVTRTAQKVSPAGTARPDWMIVSELALRLGTDLGYAGVDDVTASIAANVAGYGEALAALATNPDGIVALGQIAPPAAVTVVAPERNGYEYRLVVGRKLYDNAAGTRLSPSLAGLAEPTTLLLHPLDLDRLGAAGSSVRITAGEISVIVPVAGDHGVTRGTAWLPFNRPGVAIGGLIDAGKTVIDVKIESVGR